MGNKAGAPTVCLYKNYFHFIVGTEKYFLHGVEAVRIYIVNDYIAFIPAPYMGAGAYTLSRRTGRSGVLCRVPAFIEETHPKRGTHEVFKYRDGFAIKRYETIGD